MADNKASLQDIDQLTSNSSAMLTRMALSALLAIFVTLFLLWLMNYLIVTADRTLEDDVAGATLDFVRVKPQETLQRKSDKPEKPPAPEAPPPEPPTPELDNADPQVEKVAISAAPVSTDIDLSAGGFSLGVGEGDYLPIVKVAPMYPSRAASRGIEGTVLVEYTVTTNGTVKDVVVIESDPSSTIFHKASINAALKFKYKPRVVDGVAVEVPGVRNLFTFKLEK